MTQEPYDLTTCELDEILDQLASGTLSQYTISIIETGLEGKKVDWHGVTAPIVILDDGQIGLEVQLSCRLCKKEDKETLKTVYAVSGCHSGAYCYVVNQHGSYLADLRNDEWLCEKHSKEIEDGQTA